MRIPKVLNKKSRYSIQTRYRVRFALASYRQRFGLSYQSIFDEILDTLGHETIDILRDRQQIKEFLSGTEPSDEKIGVFVEYLKLVDPDLLTGLTDDDFLHQVGDLFTIYYFPFSGDSSSDYERALRTQRGKNFEGIYVEFERDVSDPERAHETSLPDNDQVNYTPRFLYLRYIENAPYLLASTVYFNFFNPNWWVLSKHMSDYSHLNGQYSGLYVEPTLKLYFDSLVRTPDAIADNPDHQTIIPHLERPEHEFQHSCTVESRGLLLVDKTVGLLKLRDVERRYPVFSKILWDNPSNLEAGIVAFRGLKQKDPMPISAYINRRPLASTAQSFFHKIHSPELLNYFQRISWSI